MRSPFAELLSRLFPEKEEMVVAASPGELRSAAHLESVFAHVDASSPAVDLLALAALYFGEPNAIQLQLLEKYAAHYDSHLSATESLRTWEYRRASWTSNEERRLVIASVGNLAHRILPQAKLTELRLHVREILAKRTADVKHYRAAAQNDDEGRTTFEAALTVDGSKS